MLIFVVFVFFVVDKLQYKFILTTKITKTTKKDINP